ncbi:MAG: hypothetical protein GQ539_12055 [Sulfitobacter sp.]|nr:hypothetical protein [Sulfitobacter sp.]
MTWIALAHNEDRRFSPLGLGTDKRDAPVCGTGQDDLLTRGSIMFETRQAPDGKPKLLLGYKSTFPWLRSLTFQAIPGGGVALVQVQGDDIAHAAIQHKDSGRNDVMRMTYSWDSTSKWGRLAMEDPENNRIATVAVPNPKPILVDDLRNMILGRGDQAIASDVIFAAVSDQIEPIGPMPSLLPSTPLATPWGFKPLSALKRGDTVTTQGSGVVPVLETVFRTVPACGSFAPIRLRAPYFGLQQDIIVAPDQRLVIDGPEVEYLFSKEAVLIPARHLVNGFAAMRETCGPTITYAQILLPSHETMIAAGTPAESLYIGRLRRQPDRMANSVLAGFDRSLLPEHGQPAHTVLKRFEAITLASRRAA